MRMPDRPPNPGTLQCQLTLPDGTSLDMGSDKQVSLDGTRKDHVVTS